MRKNYFAKLVRYMKNVYHIENGLNKLTDGRINPTHNTAKVVTGDITQNQYLNLAKDFAKESNSEFKETKVGNFIIKFDLETRRVLVGQVKSREIRTFYKADGRDADPFEAAINSAKELSGIK